MSWHCSRALVEAFSAASCLDGSASAPSSSTPTPEAFYWPDKTTEHSRLSRFGMTCEPLTADRGEAVLMSFLEASPARTSASPAKELASKASGLDSGEKWRGWLARYDRDSSTWKTAQCSFLEDSEGFSETWPRWGLMLDGALFPLEPQVPAMYESESGSSVVPTPTACDHKGSGRLRLERGPNNNLRDFCKINFGLLYPPVKAGEWLMWWPEGWTDLKPLETAKFLEWLQQHGDCYTERDQPPQDSPAPTQSDPK